MYTGGSDVAATLKLNVRTDGTEHLNQISSAIGAATKAATLFGAAGVAGIAAVTKISMDNEQITDRVATSTGLAAKAMRQLQDTATSMARASGQSIGGLETALGTATKTMGSLDAATKVVSASMKLAVAGIGDTASNAEMASKILQGFGVSANKAESELSRLLVASQHGAVGFEDLSTAVSKIGPQAQAAGVSLGETAGAVETLATATGEPVTRAATQVRALFQSIMVQSPLAAKAMQDFGKAAGVDLQADFDGLKAGTVSLQTVLADLEKASGGSAEKLKAMGVSTQGLIAVQNLAGEAAGKLTANLQAQARGAGEIAKQYKANQNDLDVVIGRLRAIGETAALWIGDKAKTALAGLGTAIVGVANTIQDHGKDIQKAFDDIGKAVAPVWEGIKTNAISAVKGIKAWLDDHGDSIKQFFTDVGTAAKAGFHVAQGAIEAYFKELGKKENQDKIQEGLNNLKHVANELGDAIRLAFSDKNTGGKGKSAPQQAADDTANAFQFLSDKAKEDVDQIKLVAGAGNLLAQQLNGASEKLNDFAKLLRGAAINGGQVLLDKLGDIKDILGQGLFGNSGISGFTNALSSANTPLGTLIGSIQKLSGLLGGLFDKTGIGAFTTNLWNLVTGPLQALLNKLPGASSGPSASSPSYVSRGVAVPHNLSTAFPGATAPRPLAGSLFGIPGVGTIEEINNPAYSTDPTAARRYSGVSNAYTHSDIGAVNQNVYLPGGSNARYTLTSAGFDPGGGYYELWRTPNGGYFRFYHLQDTPAFESLEARLKKGPVTVEGGVLVATSGQTGTNQNGPHLHVGADKAAYAYLQSAGAPRSSPTGPVTGPTSNTFNPNVGAGTSAAYLPNLPKELRSYWPQIVQAAQRAGIPPLVFAAQLWTESGTSGLFKVQPTYDAGEYHVGALQVGEAEAREIGDYNLWLKIRQGKGTPADQLRLGADFDAYLRKQGYTDVPGLLTRYNGSTTYRDTVLSRAAAFGAGANYNAMPAAPQHRPYFGDIGAYLAPHPTRPAGAIGVEGTPIYFGDVDVTGRRAGYNAAAIVAAGLAGASTGALGALGITGTGVEGRPSRGRTGHEGDADDANAVATAVALGLFPNLRKLNIGTAGIGAAAAVGAGVDAVYRPTASVLAQQFSDQAQKLQDTVTKYSAAAAQAILSGAGNLGNFINKIVTASNDEDRRTRATENVALRVARARGDSETILGIQTGRAQAAQSAATADIARMLLTGQTAHTISVRADDGGVGRQTIRVDDLQNSIDQAAAAARKQKDIADAEADAASRVAEASGDFSARLQYLSGKVSEVADQAMSALVLGLHEGAANLKDLVASSAATKVALDAWNIVQTAATAMQTAAIANDSKLLDVELKLADVQDIAAEVTAGFTLRLSSLRGDLGGMAQAIQQLSDLAIRRWSQAVMDGGGAMNRFVTDVQAAAKAADAVADAQTAQQIVIGRITNSFQSLSSGLQAMFSKATDKISLWTAELGRAGDGLPVLGGSLSQLTSIALKAASNLGSFSDIVSSISRVVSQTMDAAELQFARTGSISGDTIGAYQTATREQQAAAWTKVGADLKLAHSTRDVSLEMSTLSDEIALQKKRVTDAAGAYGTASAEFKRQQATLQSLQKEYEGLQNWIRINIDGEKLAADATKEQVQAYNDMAASANAAWNQFINEGLDPATAAVQGAAQIFGISATEIEAAFKKAQEASGSLADNATSAASALGGLVTAIQDAVTGINAAIATLGKGGAAPPTAQPAAPLVPTGKGQTVLNDKNFNPPSGNAMSQAAYADGFTVGKALGERQINPTYNLYSSYWYQGYDDGRKSYVDDSPKYSYPSTDTSSPTGGTNTTDTSGAAATPIYKTTTALDMSSAYYSGYHDGFGISGPMTRPSDWSDELYGNYLRGYGDGQTYKQQHPASTGEELSLAPTGTNVAMTDEQFGNYVGVTQQVAAAAAGQSIPVTQAYGPNYWTASGGTGIYAWSNVALPSSYSNTPDSGWFNPETRYAAQWNGQDANSVYFMSTDYKVFATRQEAIDHDRAMGFGLPYAEGAVGGSYNPAQWGSAANLYAQPNIEPNAPAPYGPSVPYTSYTPLEVTDSHGHRILQQIADATTDLSETYRKQAAAEKLRGDALQSLVDMQRGGFEFITTVLPALLKNPQYSHILVSALQNQ